MRTSEEYREQAGREVEPTRKMLLDAADLIDAVEWMGRRSSLEFVASASDLLAAYRASMRPAKPASGCEGCEASVNGHPNVASSYSKCLACTRYERVDRWEAKP